MLFFETRSNTSGLGWRLSLVLITVSMVLGCSSGNQPNYGALGLVDISGKITLDGKPVPGAAVCFYEPDGIRFSYGMTDRDGYYEMMFNSKKSGVTPGKKLVKISTVDIPLGAKQLLDGSNFEEVDADAQKPSKGELIPDRYNKKSTLQIDVQGASSRQNFDLRTN